MKKNLGRAILGLCMVSMLMAGCKKANTSDTSDGEADECGNQTLYEEYYSGDGIDENNLPEPRDAEVFEYKYNELGQMIEKKRTILSNDGQFYRYTYEYITKSN